MAQEIHYDPKSSLREVDLMGEHAYAQRHGKWYGYWEDAPRAGESADEIRCAECGEEPEGCYCDA